MSTGPPLYVPKKRAAQDLGALENKRQKLWEDEKKARKDIKAQGSFNCDFFNGAAEAESITLERLRVASDISFSQFDGSYEVWANREAARDLFSRMRATENKLKRYKERTAALSLGRPRGTLRALFMKLFTTSSMGLGIHTGEGKRNSTIQSNFRKRLLDDYKSLDEEGWAWCPILHSRFRPKSLVAAHIFSYKHGQEMMDEIFGKIRPSEMFSSRNGLIIHEEIEEYFDSGIFVIVPDMPDRPSLDVLTTWLTGEVRNFKVRIIDRNFRLLNRGIVSPEGLKWRDLDNRKLQFQSSARPAARYLYFHYCLQILRRAWKAGPGEKAADILLDEFGKPVWATRGRYIGHKMLRALVDTLGQEYSDLLRGSFPKAGDSSSLVEAMEDRIKYKELSNDADNEDDEDEEMADV